MNTKQKNTVIPVGIIALMAMIVLAAEIIVRNSEGIDIENLRQKDFRKAKKWEDVSGYEDWKDVKLFIMAELPEEDITLYGIKEEDGECKRLALRSGKEISYYSWSYYMKDSVKMDYQDYDGDGAKELAIVTLFGSGTGIWIEQLFLLEELRPGVFEAFECKSEEYLSQMEEMISYQIDNENRTVSFLKGDIELQRSDTSWVEEGKKVESVSIGSIIRFNLEEGITLRADPCIIVEDSVTPQYSGMEELEADIEYRGDGRFYIVDIH